MFGFKDGSTQRLAALVAVSPVFKAMADFLAATTLLDTAYTMYRAEYDRLAKAAKAAGVEIGSQYSYLTAQTDADKNARRIDEVLTAHYLTPAHDRLRIARAALMKLVGTDGHPAYDWDLNPSHIVSAVMPDRDDIVHLTPIRVE